VGSKKNTPARWKISKLKEHPRQREMFGDVSDAELNALAEDLRQNGLRQPIEILPDATILAGHQRVRAAKQLGWTEIDVLIRYDLAEAGEAAQEEFFVTDNLNRRQLTGLAKARCIRRLVELEEGRSADRFCVVGREKLLDRVAERLDLSPRNARRYLLILKAPVAVQEAYDRDEISLTNAGKAALFSREEQAELERRLRSGESVAEVIQELLARRGPKKVKTGDALARLCRSLRAGLDELDGRVEGVSAAQVAPHLAVFQEAQDLLSTLIDAAE
jgi:ParB family chromosome partitioning protein